MDRLTCRSTTAVIYSIQHLYIHSVSLQPGKQSIERMMGLIIDQGKPRGNGTAFKVVNETSSIP